MNRTAIIGALFFGGLVQSSGLWVTDGIETKVELVGSTPPVASLFSCVASLRGKPYSQAKTRKCLDQMLATGYFVHGNFRQEHNREKAVLVFHMKSPSLLLSKLEVQLKGSDKSDVEMLLAKTPGVLRLGNPYTQDADRETARLIRKFFFEQRRRIGVQSQVNLDFKAKTATVNYRIVEGPPGSGPGELEPYSLSPNCEEFVAVVDFRDANDLVPLNLVQQLMKTRFGSCFDEDSLKADVEALRNTQLFGDVDVLIEGTGQRRTVALKISGRPLPVRSLSVKCYGASSDGDCQTSVAELPLKIGAPYSRSMDWLSKDQLQKRLKDPHGNVWVFEDINPKGDSELAISYGVIFERTELSINGNTVPDYSDAPLNGSTGPH